MLKKKIKKTLILLFIIISIGIAGCNDISEDLGGGYTYRNDGGNRCINLNNYGKYGRIYPLVIDYDYNEDYIIALQNPSEKYFKILLSFDLCSMHSHSFSSEDSIRIKNIEAYNQIFLDDTVLYNNILSKKLTKNCGTKNSLIYDSIADSLIKNSPKFKLIFSRKYNYWIIKKKGDEIFGPYSENEYLEKRKEIGVPEGLQVKIE